MDKKMKDRRLSEDTKLGNRSMDRSVERPLMMLEKGLLYKEKVQKKRDEKALQETKGCTFNPEVNKKFNRVYKDPTVA
jgi:hypothetical protein